MSELTIWKPERGELVPLPGQRCTTLDLATPEGQRAAYRCHVSADGQLADLAGETITVCDLYAHHVVRTDEETGEERPGLRAVLILDNGMRIATSSESAYKCVLAWAAVAQLAPPWRPGIRFTVRRQKSTRGAGHFLWLDLPEAADGGRAAT